MRTETKNETRANVGHIGAGGIQKHSCGETYPLTVSVRGIGPNAATCYVWNAETGRELARFDYLYDYPETRRAAFLLAHRTAERLARGSRWEPSDYCGGSSKDRFIVRAITGNKNETGSRLARVSTLAAAVRIAAAKPFRAIVEHGGTGVIRFWNWKRFETRTAGGRFGIVLIGSDRRPYYAEPETRTENAPTFENAPAAETRTENAPAFSNAAERRRERHRVSFLANWAHRELKRAGGFSVNERGNVPPRTGFLVSLRRFENVFPSANVTPETVRGYFADVSPAVSVSPGRYFGGWIDQNEAFLDVSVHVPTLRAAIALALAERQVSIWDCARETAVPVSDVRHIVAAR